MPARHNRAAFSLVELSIVLVILGLLVGGILAGQSLVRAAELRSVSTDFTRYYTAVNTFRDKYFFLPGDMPNATRVWGDEGAGSCPDAAIANGNPGTCNGNGDGLIADGVSVFNSTESSRAWQMLNLAGMVEGNYVGLYWPTRRGVNIPASRVRTGAFSFTTGYSVRTANALIAGSEQSGDVQMTGGFLTPEEAWNIDSKMDDGHPGRGKITALGAAVAGNITPNCSGANWTVWGTAYVLTNTSPDCNLHFWFGS